MSTYTKGQAVLFDEAPAVILSTLPGYEGTLLIGTFAGMSSYIGVQHSKLAPLDESTVTHVFAERIAEIRAYYGLGVPA